MLLARALDLAARRPRLALALVVALALLAHAPSLAWGFFADDYAQQLVLRGEELGTLRPWSLYDFGERDGPADESLERAGYPWWIDADWKARFFRPLTSLTLWLDHAVYGDRALGYHVSNLAWFALSLCLVHALYRAVGLGPVRSLFALVVFALHSGTATSVGWIAHRNSVVALVFEVGAVLAISGVAPVDPRAPRAAAPAGTALALARISLALARISLALARISLAPTRISLALGLALCAALSKESGLAAFAIVALWLTWRARRLTWGAIAALAAGAAYLAWYLAAGFGARGPFYPSPWTDPADFARNLLVLVPGSVPSLCGFFSLDLAFLQPSYRPVLVAIALPLAVAMSAAALPVLRSSPSARMWLGWWLVTLLPLAGAPPSERLLLTTSVASAALIAELAARVLSPRAGRRVPGPARFLARGLLVSTTAGAFLGLQAVQAGNGLLALESRRAVVGADVGDPELGAREVFVLQSPNPLTALSPGATWIAEGGDRDVRFWAMQQGRRGLRWRRTDASTFELTSLDRAFLDHPFEHVFLARRPRPFAGQRWTRSLFDVEALEADGGGLRSIRVLCRGDLDDPRYRFLVWSDGRWRHVPPPAVGGEVVLPEVAPSLPLVP